MLAQTRAHVCHPRNDPKSAGASRESKYNSILRRNRALKHIVYSSQHQYHRTTPARSKKERKKERKPEEKDCQATASQASARQSVGHNRKKTTEKNDNDMERRTVLDILNDQSLLIPNRTYPYLTRPATTEHTHQHTNTRTEKKRENDTHLRSRKILHTHRSRSDFFTSSAPAPCAAETRPSTAPASPRGPCWCPRPQLRPCRSIPGRSAAAPSSAGRASAPRGAASVSRTTSGAPIE